MPPLRRLFVTGIVLSSPVAATSAYADTDAGKIVGPDGKPVPGARVFAYIFSPTDQFGTKAAKTLTSDASGTFME